MKIAAKGVRALYRKLIGNNTSLACEGNGALKKLTDAHGNRTAVTTTVNGISETTAYTFDALNRLASVTDPNNQTTS